MDKLDQTPRRPLHRARHKKQKTNWFVLAGFFAIFAGLLMLPALTSVSAQGGSWAVAATVLAVVGLMSLVVVEGWRHSPH